ncbi:MAG TPA: hypothetical protein VKF42_10505 [Chitinivibrionales bacterium]|nr:hypothetical protein [Chitinivibrionales bacterium]
MRSSLYGSVVFTIRISIFSSAGEVQVPMRWQLFTWAEKASGTCI